MRETNERAMDALERSRDEFDATLPEDAREAVQLARSLQSALWHRSLGGDSRDVNLYRDAQRLCALVRGLGEYARYCQGGEGGRSR